MVTILLLSVWPGCSGEGETDPFAGCGQGEDRVAGVMIGPATCLADESLDELCARGGLGVPWTERECPTLSEARDVWPVGPADWCGSDGWYLCTSSIAEYSHGRCLGIDADELWFYEFDPSSGRLLSMSYHQFPERVCCSGDGANWVVWGDPAGMSVCERAPSTP